MGPDALTPLTALAIPIAVAIPLLLWVGVERGARLLNLPPARRVSIVATTGALLAGWIVLALSLGAQGVYRASSDSALPALLLALAVVLPIVIGLAIVGTSRTARELLAVTPPYLLIAAQTYRVFGVIFLLLLAQRQVPSAFASPAGWGDVLVGVSAPVVAALYSRDAARWRGLAVFWNLFGLADLAVAITMGVLTAPGRLQQLALDAPNSLISSFPLVLIPTVAVPTSILLHLLTLRRLRMTRRAVVQRAATRERAA